MEMPWLDIVGGLLTILWGVNLWEIRKLRADNAHLTKAISDLTATIAGLTVELSHKMSKEECAIRMSKVFHRRLGDSEV